MQETTAGEKSEIVTRGTFYVQFSDITWQPKMTSSKNFIFTVCEETGWRPSKINRRNTCWIVRQFWGHFDSANVTVLRVGYFMIFWKIDCPPGRGNALRFLFPFIEDIQFYDYTFEMLFLPLVCKRKSSCDWFIVRKQDGYIL